MEQPGFPVQQIFNLSPENFESFALEVFRYQAENNPVYNKYLQLLHRTTMDVKSIKEIPFIPISFFKGHRLISGNGDVKLVFESSGTTGSSTSRHYVTHPEVYEESFKVTFKKFYGDIEEWCILALLPSYLERQHSSLVYMADRLIRDSKHTNSGFFLNNYDDLAAVIIDNEKTKKKTLLLGVTYALIDFAEKFPMPFKHTIVMETGGMKGRKKEMTRNEVHEILNKQFETAAIHSEYGMTELFSQAYSSTSGIFQCPSWMKVLVRDEDDPFSIRDTSGKKISGAGNVIDLANIYSCSFIATDDLVTLHPDETFEVLGRIDNSDIRGCALLV